MRKYYDNFPPPEDKVIVPKRQKEKSIIIIDEETNVINIKPTRTSSKIESSDSEDLDLTEITINHRRETAPKPKGGNKIHPKPLKKDLVNKPLIKREVSKEEKMGNFLETYKKDLVGGMESTTIKDVDKIISLYEKASVRNLC